MTLLQRAAWEQWLEYDRRTKPKAATMTDAEQLARIRDILRPVVDVGGLSVEDAVRKCRTVWLDEVRMLNDNLTQAIDSNLIATRERDAALAAAARERTYAGELEGCLQSIATAVTGSPDTSGIVVRVEELVAERDAIRALPIPPSNEEPKR